jgi:signal transduction histidine kinase/CheY-like chemotaxis protein
LPTHAYRLEGYDKEWLQTDSGRRVAAYTNLSPGNYRLLLRGSNHNGLWNDKEFALPLRILPAWYQTWWAHLAELAAVLAAMAVFVQLRTRYLRSKRKELEHVVKERTAELTVKNSELAHLNRLQEERQSELTRFLAVASHDLRQPMHALNIYLGALLNVDVPLNARTLLGKVRQCASIMDDMFLALLDLSRLDAGVVRPNVKRFAIATVLKTLMVEFSPQAEAKGLVLECPLSEDWVESDPGLVQQILGNLIANAVRYTEKGGIRIACRTAKGRLLVSVADSGIGIPLHHQKTIFEEFLQLGNSGHDRTKGLGLGLAIVKRLSRLLGTPVTLVSEAGNGATFTLDLPLAEAHPGDPTRLIGEGQENSEALEGKLAVVIDDERSILDSTRILLEQWGCRVITAQSSMEARAALGDKAPDVLICDYRLHNGESGIDAINALIEEFNRDIPALVITGDTAPDLIRDTLSTGLPVIYKPLQAAALREALLRLVTARTVIV